MPLMSARTSKMIEIDIANGKPVRASDQFGTGAKR
jgi:hypothetical protein